MDTQYQEDLCQFFTSASCSDALIAEIDSPTPRWIADVGAGHGSLASAAMRRWGGVQIALFDRDPAALRALKLAYPNASRFHADFLIDRMPRNTRKWLEQADVVLCNPPFRMAPPETTDRWLVEAGMPNDWPYKIKSRAELVFLAHNLRMLRPDGELVMILPAAFINGHEFEPFRSWLLSSHTVSKVIQLPASAFTTADVRAYAIIARKSPPPKGHSVKLIDLQNHPHGSHVIRIPTRQGVARLDPGFHRFKGKSVPAIALTETGAVISRGRPVATLSALGTNFFHTTDFAHHAPGAGLRFSTQKHHPQFPMAATGDILMGRIGRNCHSQILHVTCGKSLFSDCVYRIEVPEPYRAAVLSSLTAPYGIRWRLAHLRGSTVALISKQDLLRHPVWLEP